MKNRIIYTSEMCNYENVFKFGNIGDTVEGRYVGVIHMRGKYPQDYILLRLKTGHSMVKLYSQFADIINVFRRDDIVRIKLADIIESDNNPGQKFYKFKIQILVQGEDNGETEEAPF